MSVFQHFTPKQYIYHIVTGKGMEPEFVPGDELYLDYGREPGIGDYVVPMFDQPGTVFQLVVENGRSMLRSLDPKHPPLELGDFMMCGVVVYRGKTLNN